MGGYAIVGAGPIKADPKWWLIGWLNLPTRNLFYDLLDDSGGFTKLEAATAARCTGEDCFVLRRQEFESICNGANTFLQNHQGRTDRKRVTMEDPSDHWDWAKSTTGLFLESFKKRLDYVVFYDDFSIHDCTWPEPFTFLPRRRFITKDL